MDTTPCTLPAGFLLPTPEGPAREWQWTCRLVPKSRGRHALHLSGSLHAAWAGRLAAGLGARHIGVVRATARRGSTRWTAEIELEVPRGSPAPSALEVVALMREHVDPGRAGAIALSGHRLTPTRRDVRVELRAADAVGFLGSILLVFAELGLFPRAMQVETVGAEVRDVFFLQTLAGETPPVPVVAALRRRLDALVVPE
jgi:hypothetical protein